MECISQENPTCTQTSTLTADVLLGVAHRLVDIPCGHLGIMDDILADVHKLQSNDIDTHRKMLRSNALITDIKMALVLRVVMLQSISCIHLELGHKSTLQLELLKQIAADEHDVQLHLEKIHNSRKEVVIADAVEHDLWPTH